MSQVSRVVCRLSRILRPFPVAGMARSRRSSPSAPRPLSAGEVRAVWIYVQTVLASLALVLCGSWRPFSPSVADPFALATALPDTMAINDAAVDERTSAAVVATWQAAAPEAEQQAAVVRLSDAVRAVVPSAGDTVLVDPETLWLARCMYSESNLPHEQELVAWVVRNRVATGYRGRWTYRDVVLDPMQFSAFNYDSGKRRFYASILPGANLPGWRRTLAIAEFVRRAPWSRRPFEIGVRHFYSPVSMVGRRAPTWAYGHRSVQPNRLYAVDPYRFQFLALREARWR